MPQIDKPLSELKNYLGRNPRPRDFDAYWDRALAELDALDPDVELRPAEFRVPGVECFHLFFTGVGGARVHAKYLRPAASEAPHPAMLQFHGYSHHSGDWAEKLGYVSLGFSVAALDCRGQGGWSEDVGGVRGNTFQGHIIRGLDDHQDKLLFRQIFLDTAQLARVVMNLAEVDAERVGATGGSQGGGLTLACASLEPRVKKVAAVFPFLCDYQRVWEMDLTKTAYAELSKFFRHFDPRHEREEEIFTRLGYIDCQHLASRIRADVLFATGLMDETCPASSQFAAYNRLTAWKRMIIYPDFGHEALPDVSDAIFAFMADL